MTYGSPPIMPAFVGWSCSAFGLLGAGGKCYRWEPLEAFVRSLGIVAVPRQRLECAKSSLISQDDLGCAGYFAIAKSLV